jgi:succinoglycan biosynthesis transport protein ExoP
MEEVAKFDSNIGQIIRRRSGLGAVVAVVLLMITVLLAVGLPPVYKSRAVILIEAQEMPQDLVRSLVTSFADQRIQVISQRVLTNSNLSQIIERYDLYSEERKHDPLEIILEQMRSDIAVTPISAEVADPKAGRSMQATIAFELTYENKNPNLAQRVANEIASLFLSENLRQRSETSKETLSFLSAEQEKLGGQVADLESKLAVFKKGNVEQLPELNNLNIELLNRAEGDMRALDVQMRSLEEQRLYIESELAQQKPVMGLFATTGERILGPSDRLKMLEAEFSPLAAKYGPNHPDVISKKKEINSLKTQVGVDRSQDEVQLKLKKARTDYLLAKQRYSAEHPDVKRLAREVEALEAKIASSDQSLDAPQSDSTPDNPAFIQLRAKLEGTVSDLRALSSQRAEVAAKTRELERRISTAPEVERQYRALTRDYDNAQLKYREITSKRQEAELASNLESEQKGEKFILIEPPVTPEQPARPNRIAIVLLGVALAIAGAVGSGAIAEATDGRFYGRAGVVRVVGSAPLAVIPLLRSEADLRQRFTRRVVITAGVVLALLGILVFVHYFVRPLDVIGFQILRRVSE